ncbi:MAG: substrate-binding domain-containing protein [Gemmatimonadota bacterium]
MGRRIGKRRGAAALACVLLLGGGSGSAAAQPASSGVDGEKEAFRVCADPNNLPFSNRREEGFENKLAEMIAAELGTSVQYTWWPQRRGFIRNTLREKLCDVVMGVPSSYELVLTTKPYYRSTYVFLYRKDAGLELRTLDDPVLRELRIGVHIIGDDYANSPPAHALSNRNIVQNVVGYSVYGDYNEPNPPARIVDAVESGDVDVAIVWGPIAGYFSKGQPLPLEIVPVSPQIDLPFLPFVFDVSMGVRREDEELRDGLERILDKKAAEIRALLEEYGVPIVGIHRRSAASPREGESP